MSNRLFAAEKYCLMVFLALGLIGAGGAQERHGHTAITPLPRTEAWLKRHQTFVGIAQKGNVDLLLLGDSITDDWGGEGHPSGCPGSKVFAREFVPLKAANFGISGDRTQHLLWRLQNGELHGISPKVVMVMIGTNNSNGSDNTAEEIADGIAAVVREIRQRTPQSKVLLLGIFPRGEKPNRQRDKIKEVNAIIAKLDDGGKSVKYLDVGDRLVQPDGTISKEIMPDYLHLSEKGYEVWADAVKSTIATMIGKN
jgi:lysophospholipase L1-like esterase